MKPFSYNVWRTWFFDAPVIAFLTAAAVAYAIAAGRRGWQTARALVFYGGLATIFIALQSVIDVAGDCCLFTLHMVQHELLLLLAPALLIWGLKDLLPQPRGLVARLVAFLTHPAHATGILLANLYLWHLPVAYDLALRSDPVHKVEHLLYLATGLMFWWPLIEPVRLAERAPQSLAAKLLQLLTAGIAMLPLGLILLEASRPFYPFYLQAPRPSGWSALLDQQMAGAAMLFGNSAVMGLALGGGFLTVFGFGNSHHANASRGDDGERSRLGPAEPNLKATCHP